MTIAFDEQTGTFHLRAGDCSYVMQLHKGSRLAHRYFGARLRRDSMAQPIDETFSLEVLPQEYPTYGISDFRVPAIEVQAHDGSTATDLRYAGHRILPGKPSLPGLPATYVEQETEADTLEIDLLDPLTEVRVTLRYTAFAEHSVIARSVSVTNGGTESVRLLRVLSAALDLSDADYEYRQLSGAWARERTVVQGPVTGGGHWIESRRGASSHQQNPCFALARPGTDERRGEVLALALVYSGNFLMGAEVDQFRTLRVAAGINPFDFAWHLEAGETFHAPEALLAYSGKGWGGLSRSWHRLFRTRLARGSHRDLPRPILINNWEATYFSFDRETLLDLGSSAAELGVELFVLDDGWFGKRDDDGSSLGDWTVDLRKLPGGLANIARELGARGMRFGLWFEPEMVSPDSDLYRAHPDWCLHVPGRERTLGRNQLVLDFSREDVCAEIVRRLTDILQSAPIRYVKWDMNRHMTEVGSALLPAHRQRETAHRYMLGLYRVMEEVTRRFPDILFESCSGGGGRFDPGMLYYMPQVWTSDNTDAIARLDIQFGTSQLYPASAMGAHVSAVPNHQVGRVTPLATRGLVAMMGNLGYELDVRKLSQEERDMMKEQIAFYKRVRPLVQFGDLYRLRDPANARDAAWMYVNAEKTEALVTYVRILAEANAPQVVLRLDGLDPQRDYRLERIVWEQADTAADGRQAWIAGGDELMSAGLVVPRLVGDYDACAWRLEDMR